MRAPMSHGATEVAGATSRLGEQIQAALGGAFVVERELAVGGSAHLFLATDTALGRRVVLKILPPELGATVDAARFHREIQLAARLTHPNIVPLLSAGSRDSFLYYTMPYVEGESLHARLARDTELPIADAVSILRDLARALAYAHAHGVIHRDVKPDNVLLDGCPTPDRPAGGCTALLTDFGIAKAIDAASGAVINQRATAAGVAVGTPTYVSPEQASGDPKIDHRSDLYSLGVVAYEMLCGQPPFTHRSLQAVLSAHRSEPPPPIATRRQGIPTWLAQLVMRLLEKRPADRPQSADEVVQVIESAVSVSDAPPQRARAPWAHRLPIAVATAVAAALLVLALGAGMRRHDHAAAARRAFPVAPAATATRDAADDAIAVLPFAPVGRDSVEQLFADGLADDLTSALGALPGLRVASRTSVAALQGSHLTAAAIADSLRVGRILEGTVERSGGRLRITAQLTGARDGLALWSATYERAASDLFAVQDEITADIVRALAPGAAPAH